MSLDEKFYRARITERVDVAPGLWRFRVDPGGEFRFQPGQYATLGVESANKRVERPYSIASSPYEEEVEFFVELVPHGSLTPELHKLRQGSEMLMRKTAKGRFTLDVKGGRANHLLISTVTGLAPFISYIRTLCREHELGGFPQGHRFFLIHGASRSWELGYHDEVEQIAGSVPWLTYVATVSRPWEDHDWTGEVGRVDDLLRKYLDQWNLESHDTTAYLCGHPQMIEHSKGILTRFGFGSEALKEEVYWAPKPAPGSRNDA